ncbi:hypothetical protein GXP67_25540 [Rhodocytophaga rosea]|uniref:Uncharacterized protein n=1 Tax=Rhodocytophaga rosea TaxID=2704465 RepID=A0A6C0GNZ2_9BACT|nr:hypothetical protein [Rhodocytophaga rosea]QHT69768.1 hypothetical protein GXP67_25540 [Rhodocytophaga rosea]
MENGILRRNYLFSDPYLHQLCNEKIVIAGRDFHKLFFQNAAPVSLTALSARNIAFKDLPSEYELTCKLEEASETKSYLAAQLRTGIRNILHRLSFQPDAVPASVQKLEKPCLEQLTDIDLLSYGKSLVQTLSPSLSDIRDTGLTPAMMSTLLQICYEFDLAIDKLRKTVCDCDLINAQRIKIGNQIYEELLSLCNKGKQTWAGINEAKYNDYVILGSPHNSQESVKPSQQ